MREGRTNVGFCRVSVAIMYTPIVVLCTVANSNRLTTLTLWCASIRKTASGGMSLTEGLVLKRSKASSLEAVRNLNCWGCGLSDVSILAKMSNLEVLNLRY